VAGLVTYVGGGETVSLGYASGPVELFSVPGMPERQVRVILSGAKDRPGHASEARGSLAPPTRYGTKIAFASDRSGQYQVYVMSATGGSPVRITHTSTMEAEPFWSH
jgi:WD40-like Beta Propeller Repeat